jgi:hypothetical protein
MVKSSLDPIKHAHYAWFYNPILFILGGDILHNDSKNDNDDNNDTHDDSTIASTPHKPCRKKAIPQIQ